MAASNFRLRDRYWPRIVDIETARRVARQGAWAAILVAAITAVIATLAVAGYSILGVDAWAFGDVLLFGGIAWGIWKMSRVAALAALALFVVEKFLMWEGGVNPLEFVAVVVFTLFFVNSVRAAFAYHRLRKPKVSVDTATAIGPR